MLPNCVKNAQEFNFQQLKCTMGQIPNEISGRYLRNGSGLLNIQNSVQSHWFLGDGIILMIEIKNGKCWGELKYVQTNTKKKRLENKKLTTNFITKFTSHQNTSNTSVMFLHQSQNFLALCEAGLPFVIKKTKLEDQKGFSNFGWIQGGFSAHPKVDPENADIYNIGTNFKNQTLTLSHSNKQMKLIKDRVINLRNLQSIHDFCLAGDYIVIFECSMNLSLWKLLTSACILSPMVIDENLPVLVHVFKKSDFSHLRTIEADPFYIFHFANGCSSEQKINLQYCRYNIKEAKQLFQFLSHFPKYSAGSKKKFELKSQIQEMEIDLKTFKIKTIHQNQHGDFPVCFNSEVGKDWRYSYFALSKKEQGYFNRIGKYDRKQNKWVRTQERNAIYNEPTLIQSGNKVYILVVVNEQKSTFVEIYDDENLKRVCQMQLPGHLPPGFHGKWESQQ